MKSLILNMICSWWSLVPESASVSMDGKRRVFIDQRVNVEPSVLEHVPMNKDALGQVFLNRGAPVRVHLNKDAPGQVFLNKGAPGREHLNKESYCFQSLDSEPQQQVSNLQKQQKKK